MKDQRAILNKCIRNDEPVFVIAGHDMFAIPTLECYLEIARQNGGNKEFLEDMQCVINEMVIFQKQESNRVKIPSLKYDEIEK